ncbi:MAG: hypothetical protein ACK4ND_06025 [Cytophagaceae bacterium]
MLISRRIILHSCAILVVCLNCCVCCPKHIIKKAKINFHFEGLTHGDTLILGFINDWDEPEEKIFLYKESPPFHLHYDGTFSDENSSWLRVKSDFLVIKVPKKEIVDTLDSFSRSYRNEGRCNNTEVNSVSLRKGGVLIGPGESIDLFYE